MLILGLEGLMTRWWYQQGGGKAGFHIAPHQVLGVVNHIDKDIF